MALKAAIVVMTLLIVAGVAVLSMVVVGRVGGGGAGSRGLVALDEPAGTVVAGSSLSADRLALQLRGGGPDRVVVVDVRTGAVVARVGLAR